MGERRQGSYSSGMNVTGKAITNVVEDELIAIDGATGTVEYRVTLPRGPHLLGVQTGETIHLFGPK